MKKNVLFIVLLICFPVILAAAGERMPPMPADPVGKAAWLKAVLGDVIGKVTDPNNHFYGAVVDQHGAPVVGAEVDASWPYISFDLRDKVKVVTLTTDVAGRFDFTFGFFGPPLIREIRRKGYEYDRTLNSYNKSNENVQDALISKSSTSPIVFTLRKMGTTTYLQHDGEIKTYFDQPNEFVVYDLFDRGFDAIDRDLAKLRAPELYDLIFDVTKDGGNYSVKVLPVQETGSMQFLNQLLYEAPAGGYQPEATIIITNGEERTTYLYFTSRKPPVYSRMKIVLIASEEKLIFRYDTWTNPYGSRNLEYEPDLPADLHKKLRHEAEKALKSGKLPPEPNIPQLIASGLYN